MDEYAALGNLGVGALALILNWRYTEGALKAHTETLKDLSRKIDLCPRSKE